MTRNVKIGIAVAAVVALGGGGAAIAGGVGDDDESEKPVTGSALQKASAAALEHTGGGKVTDTEVGDEESKYEVEVTRPDGSQVDVQLDEQFSVVGAEGENGEDDGED